MKGASTVFVPQADQMSRCDDSLIPSCFLAASGIGQIAFEVEWYVFCEVLKICLGAIDVQLYEMHKVMREIVPRPASGHVTLVKKLII